MIASMFYFYYHGTECHGLKVNIAADIAAGVDYPMNSSALVDLFNCTIGFYFYFYAPHMTRYMIARRTWHALVLYLIIP